MRYLSAFYTDIGTQKKSNQDSLLIQEANTASGTMLLTVLCDGLGGLQSIFRLVSISVSGSFEPEIYCGCFKRELVEAGI